MGAKRVINGVHVVPMGMANAFRKSVRRGALSTVLGMSDPSAQRCRSAGRVRHAGRSERGRFGPAGHERWPAAGPPLRKRLSPQRALRWRNPPLPAAMVTRAEEDWGSPHWIRSSKIRERQP
jgi:hypothetical protein